MEDRDVHGKPTDSIVREFQTDLDKGERLIRHALCPVLVTPMPVAPRRRARVPARARTLVRARPGVVAGQGA